MKRLLLCGLPALILPLSVAGCSGIQSALDPVGSQARSILDLFWLITWVCAGVYAAVVLALIIGLVRARRTAEPPSGPLALDPGTERRAGWTVGTAIVLTVAVLFVFTIASFLTDRGIASLGARDDALEIQVTGNQWWWEVLYIGSDPSRNFYTANEIYIPVDRPIRITLKSNDVIHSLWVPNLHGKQDLIPGRENNLHFVADRPGTYRGQCAEFCGLQHARMALTVTAVAPDEFQSWWDAQLKSAPEPMDERTRRGKQIFLSGPCMMCHAINGTTAQGRTAPDLTHVASRATLAAGTLPNTRGHLAGWIVDPQQIKPGNHMTMNLLPPDDLQALLDYLGMLK
jgi:cytochrome c oxidase subunit 2